MCCVCIHVCVCVCACVLLGVKAGTVVVTNKSFNPFLEEKHEVVR